MGEANYPSSSSQYLLIVLCQGLDPMKLTLSHVSMCIGIINFQSCLCHQIKIFTQWQSKHLNCKAINKTYAYFRCLKCFFKTKMKNTRFSLYQGLIVSTGI